MIRNKNIDEAIKMVEEVIVYKRPVRMASLEYPHQHGKGVAGACYPIEACKHFLRLLKNLKANALHHELELEKVVIFCKADKASRPYRRGGARFKRTNLMLKLVKKENSNKDKIEKKNKEAKK
jgi:ribosomal protein L22